jgi:hypothetical protein
MLGCELSPQALRVISAPGVTQISSQQLRHNKPGAAGTVSVGKFFDGAATLTSLSRGILAL